MTAGGPAGDEGGTIAPILLLMLASAQTLANALPMCQLAPDRAVVFCSKDAGAQASARRLRSLMPAGHLSVVPLSDELTFPPLLLFARAQVAELRTLWPVHRLVLNATGGTKLMSFAFMQALNEQDSGTVVYCDTHQGVLSTIGTDEGDDTPLRPDLLDLPAYLRLQGRAHLMMRGAEPLDRLLLRATQRRSLSQSLALEPSVWGGAAGAAIVGVLHDVAQKSRPGQGYVAAPAETTLACTPAHLQAWQALGPHLAEHRVADVRVNVPLDGGGGPTVALKIRSHGAAVYLSGGYLEELVLLAAWAAMQDIGVPGTHLGTSVQLQFAPGSLPDGVKGQAQRNELDVALVWRNRLLIIECKAGKDVKSAREQDVLNKLHQLRTTVGGPLSSAWLVTPRTVDPSHALAARSKDYGLRLVQGTDALRNLRKAILDWLLGYDV